MSSVSRPVVVALALAAAVAAAPSTSAQSKLHVLLGSAPDQGFAQEVASVGDIDGDGGTDLALSSTTQSGTVRVHSGRTGALLYAWTGTALGGQFGYTLDGGADVDGDRVPDIAVSQPNLALSIVPGVVTVFSGATGAPVLELTVGQPDDAFGYALVLLGDVTGDGRSEIAVSATKHDDGAAEDVGRLTVHSGAGGAVLWSFVGAEFGDAPVALAEVGDVDGDGRSDLAVGQAGWSASDAGRVQLLSGVDGRQLAEYTGAGSGDGLGFQLAAMGDVDGDRVPDVSASASQIFSGAGYVQVLSGSGSGVLLTVANTSGGFADLYGWSLAASDVDGDGVRDVIVGVPGYDGTLVLDAGAVRIYSGATGAILHTSIGARLGDRYGQSCAGLADADGDGRSDFVVGGPQNGTPGGSGFPGYAIVWSIPGPWADLGSGLGSSGTIAGAPQLSAIGTLCAGSPLTLQLTGAPGGALNTLVIGTSLLSAPFKGGVMIAQPSFLVLGLSTGPDGGLTLVFTWPPGVPSDTPVYFQHWIAHGSGPAGFLASNGLAGTTP